MAGLSNETKVIEPFNIDSSLGVMKHERNADNWDFQVVYIRDKTVAGKMFRISISVANLNLGDMFGTRCEIDAYINYTFYNDYSTLQS